jgi:hypothetical protein
VILHLSTAHPMPSCRVLTIEDNVRDRESRKMSMKEKERYNEDNKRMDPEK